MTRRPTGRMSRRAALVACLASLALATGARAEQYPPGPDGCCPDTLTIINLRNPDAIPHPVEGDVVLGVGGIITAFNQSQAPFAFYMQMSNGLPYSGVTVFTGNEDHGPGTPYNLQPGDSVVVYGKVQHFSGANAIGETEGGSQAFAPFSMPPIEAHVLVRLVSHGNPEPPMHFGTLAELDESRSNPAAEPWAGMLVRLQGPVLVVAGGSEGTFLVVSPSCSGTACDTVLVDGTSLAEVPPPPPGTVLAFVQGVFDLRQGAYRIQLRGPGDFLAPTFSLPLNVSKSGTASRDPDIVRGANGELFMAWGRVFHESAHSLSLDNTSNWSLAVPIPHQGVQPAVAVTASNKFCVVASGTDQLFFKQSTDGGFQMDPLVTTVDPSPTRYPALAVGGGEHLHAAWERPGSGIFYSRSLTGGFDFSTPVPIAPNALPSETNSMARICATQGDTVLVFWQYHRSGEPPVDRVLYSRSLDGGLTFSAPRRVRDESNPLTSVVKLAILGDAQIGPDGTVYVMGLQEGGPEESVAFLRSTNGGATFALVGHPTAPAPAGLCPKSFVVGPAGAIHALVGVCGAALYYTRSSDGGATWGGAVDVTGSTSSEVGEPRGAKIILDAAGKPLIVWFAPVGGSTEIHSARLLN